MPSLFEDEFQAFVEDGGLDQVDGIVSEDYERARMKTLCLHGKASQGLHVLLCASHSVLAE